MRNEYNESVSDDNDDDDDDDSTFGDSHRPEQITKKWDVFQEAPPSADTGSMANQHRFEVSIKIIKVFVYVATFMLVLGSAVISKGTLLFMTSQLQVNSSNRLSYCNLTDVTRQYEVQIPAIEQIAWHWCLLFALIYPEVMTLFRSLRICMFKSCEKPAVFDFILVLTIETLHTFGIVLLVFVILPDLDVVKGVMLTNCVCFVPGFLGLISRPSNEESRSTRHILKLCVDCLALMAQVSGFIAWPLIEGNKPVLWWIPVSVFCISCAWWENYVTLPKWSNRGILQSLCKLLFRLKDPRFRYFTYLFVSVWKMILYFCFMILFTYKNDDPQNEYLNLMFSNFSTAFNPRMISITETAYFDPNLPNLNNTLPIGDPEDIEAWHNASWHVLIIHIICTHICFFSGRFACKILIQNVGYAFPVNLTVPVTVSLLIAICGIRNADPCAFSDVIPSYLFFNSPPFNGLSLTEFISQQHVWVWLLWLLSQAWITIHIWNGKNETLAATDKLFVTPMYDTFLIDQSLALNRRRDKNIWDVTVEDLENLVDPHDLDFERRDSIHPTAMSNSDFILKRESSKVKPSDRVTRIYACATMWHETCEEMIVMLMSVLRMDDDQSARRNLQKYLDMVDDNYYEFQTHIFFDDAFETKDEERIVNRFVRDLIVCLEEAVFKLHRSSLQPPAKIPTPYGGRLLWTLPGNTKLIVHLKDKDKIRHRKRWSQVMYMYYLLGHRLMELPIHVDRKALIAQNTYLLALDGDIDFRPHAVRLLIDLMKKNQTLGAACGRIHPIGEGPMVWYQMFEYAIGHWLQKATEHMIGCVLCSPGCFSLFRGRALMDDGVMKRYTFTPTEARHYVQYDQGEDRWLCTLLLQQGYRVEYSAASDAYTHCPEGFNEFYNQRRRWVPSTMANIMDLLSDSKKTIQVNDNISMPYVAYQVLLMGGSILGPGTIFLMLVGGFVAAFDIDNWTSFYYNSIPILIYVLVCALFKSKIQLFVAMVISAVYGLVMMAVLVGIMLQIQQDGPMAPSSLFFFVIAGQMVITALLHPQEINCLPAGVVYYVTVPSMYLLLIIYSIFNLDNISWGTRETPQAQETKTKKEIEEEKKLAEEAKKNQKGNSLISFLQGVGSKNDSEEGSLEFSIAGLFKCLLCTHPKSVDDKLQLVRIGESLEALRKKLDVMERRLDPVGVGARRRTVTSVDGHMVTVTEDPEEGLAEDEESTHNSSTYEAKLVRHDLINPYWIEDQDLKGPIDYLKDEETSFWKDLIGKYLHPIEENKEDKARITKELKRLRNKSVFAFFMLNALFVLVVFLLQLKKDFIHINWPMGVKMDIRFNSTSKEISIVKTYLSLEPVGMVFVIFFATIMVIQFVAMLLHRFGTLSHILASTSLSFGCGKKKIDIHGNKVDEDAVETAIQMQKININRGSYQKVDTRKTIHKLNDKANRKPTVNNLDEGFRKTLHMLQVKGADSTIGRKLTVSQDTVQKMMKRRTTVLERRKSQKKSVSSSIDNSPGHKSVKFSDEPHNIGFDEEDTSVSILY